jgi:hypothetical protein
MPKKKRFGLPSSKVHKDKDPIQEKEEDALDHRVVTGIYS